ELAQFFRVAFVGCQLVETSNQGIRVGDAFGLARRRRRVTRHGKLPPWRREELPPPRVAEERANERGRNHGKSFVERSTGADNEDARRSGGDGSSEGVWLGGEADSGGTWLQPPYGEALRGGGRSATVPSAEAGEGVGGTRGLAARAVPP